MTTHEAAPAQTNRSMGITTEMTVAGSTCHQQPFSGWQRSIIRDIEPLGSPWIKAALFAHLSGPLVI